MISKKQKIVVLHGWTDREKSIELWDLFNSELAKIGFEVIFLKLPNLLDANLKNNINQDKAWTLNDYVSWLDNKIETIYKKSEASNITLLGHSFGGQIASKYLANFSESKNSMVSSLILIDSAGLIDQRIHKVIKRNVFYLLSKLFSPLKQFNILRKIVYKIIGEKDYYNANKIQQSTMHNVINEDISGSLAKINLPTLIIWGSLDQVTPVHLAEIFKQNIENSELFFVNGAKHSPQFTHTTETVNIIKNFLRKLEK